MRDRVPVTFTIAPELLAEIDDLARQDNRPRSRMIEVMLAEAAQSFRRRRTAA